MLRISLTVCVSLLIYGIAAKPYKAWGKVADVALQDTMRYDDDEEKLSWGLKEVEPPEEMDATSYDVEPSMAIWKSFKVMGQQGQYLKAEEDMDELYHPAMIQTLDAQPQGDNTFHLVDAQPAPQEGFARHSDVVDSQTPEVGDWVRVHLEPEEDRDGLYHADRSPLVQVDRSPFEPVVRAQPQARVHLGPEEDRDGLYHADRSPLVHVDRSPFEPVIRAQPQARVHLEPEPDMDDRYHRERVPARYDGVNVPVPVQGRWRPVEGQSQTKYSQPEEDRDHLYH